MGPTPARAPTTTPAPTRAPTPSATPIALYHAPPYIVAIDPGHGGPYYFGATHHGSAGRPDLLEKDVNLDVALRLTHLLGEAGYGVLLIRNGDYTLTNFDPYDYRTSLKREVQARVDMTNGTRADILVSVHFNGSEDSSLSGTEVYYNPERPFAEQSSWLASFVQTALLEAIRGLGYDVRDRGVRNDADVGGDPAEPHSFLLGTPANFRPSLMPGIIAEALFLSNDADAELLYRDDAREAIAQAYKQGIDRYFAWLNGN